MNKTILAILIGAFLISGALYVTQPKEINNNDDEEVDVVQDTGELISCLEEKGVVIYGGAYCPFCAQLAESLGGYDAIEAIYVECTEKGERCNEEMQTDLVPEIQIKGELYEGGISPEEIAQAVGCEL